MDLELLVIGATSAGWQAAVTAAQAGVHVGMVAPPLQPDAGWVDLRQVSDEFLHDICADWPLHQPVNRPTGSRQDAAIWRQFAEHVAEAWRLEQELQCEQFLSDGGTIWTADVELIDANAIRLSDPSGRTRELSAAHLLLATGTRPRRPRFAAQEIPGVHDAAALFNASSIPRSACIVGGGVTGLRAACLLAWWGSHVTVIDGKSSVHELADETSIDWLNWAAELGVQFDCGEDVIAIQAQTSRRTVLILESGRRLVAESVWLATGRCGETDGLHLECAGLTADDRGRLWCDDRNRTWADSISAIGDIVGFCPEVRSDSEVARHLVQSLFESDYVNANSVPSAPERYLRDPAHTFERNTTSCRK